MSRACPGHTMPWGGRNSVESISSDASVISRKYFLFQTFHYIKRFFVQNRVKAPAKGCININLCLRPLGLHQYSI